MDLKDPFGNRLSFNEYLDEKPTTSPEATPKTTTNPQTQGRPLTEAEIDFLETSIPELAQAACTIAYWQTLMAGNSVMISEGDALYEVFPDGSRRWVKNIEPPTKVKIGEILVLRCASRKSFDAGI